jgi:hypothetical protein
MKYVTFTVELACEADSPLGVTLSVEDDADAPALVVVSALAPGGMADRTGAIRAGDTLVEVDGVKVQGRSLNQVVDMLQRRRISQDAESPQGECIIKLKLSRLLSIPEREPIYWKKPPLPITNGSSCSARNSCQVI